MMHLPHRGQLVGLDAYELVGEYTPASSTVFLFRLHLSSPPISSTSSEIRIRIHDFPDVGWLVHPLPTLASTAGQLLSISVFERLIFEFHPLASPSLLA